MREILFRGKKKNNGEWIEGDLIHIPNGVAILANGYAYIDPKTIGQYTGLTDKSGTKIFEGDILQFTNSDNEQTDYEVLWFTNKWVVLQCKMTVADDLDIFFCKHSEIIGNIYDNPELLEESE